MERKLTQLTQERHNLRQPFELQLRSLYTEQVRRKRTHIWRPTRTTWPLSEGHKHFLSLQPFYTAYGHNIGLGCNHAPTACMVKMLRGDAVRIYGCDLHSEDFRVFYDFADLQYTQLTHPYLLPYESGAFDAVIGTAVLEHVPNDSESLKELYRILKPGGLLIVTTLPNRYSYTEWLNRQLQRPHHLRLYSLNETKQTFLHHGFLPIESGYHQVFPSMCSTGGVFNSRFVNRLADSIASQNKIGETLWPLRCFASNVFIVSKKVAGIDNGDFDIRKRLKELTPDN